MIPLRQPLQSATIKGFKNNIPNELLQVLAEEVNVKEVFATMPKGQVHYKRKYHLYD